jgi:glycosyltransferase involved in cell wall biosynthesis
MLARGLGALTERGDDVVLLVPEDGPLVELMRGQGISVRVVRFPVLRKSLMSPLGVLRLFVGLLPALLRLRALIRRLAPDVIYVNTVTLPHWTAFGRALSGRPVVCHVRELEEQSPTWLNRILLAPLLRADLVVANSLATQAFLARHWRSLRSRTTVIYNGFDVEDLPERSPAPGRPRVAVVGRLSPRKGQDVAIDAFARVVESGHDPELHVIGTSFRGYEWYESSLRDQARALGVADRVIFRGYVREVVEELATTSISLVPSRLEPFGNVAVEAQLAACPVVVTSVGGLPEIVDDGHSGRVVPADDAAALASALGRLLDDPAQAEELGRVGRTEARKRFDLHRYADELSAALDSAAGADRPCRPPVPVGRQVGHLRAGR